jgi:kynurenine 3-monooxygenase
MIGADGAHSAVRYHMMKFTRMDYQQEYIDTLWCEFRIEPQREDLENPDAKFRISPNHLHIWPGKEFMFIAIPSEVRHLRSLMLDTIGCSDPDLFTRRND